MRDKGGDPKTDRASLVVGETVCMAATCPPHRPGRLASETAYVPVSLSLTHNSPHIHTVATFLMDSRAKLKNVLMGCCVRRIYEVPHITIVVPGIGRMATAVRLAFVDFVERSSTKRTVPRNGF